MPNFSIIVPTRNRANMLLTALESIEKVADPSESIDVIIVDNGSSDQTKAVCERMGPRFRRNELRYFYDDMPGLLTGRHRGAREAKGEILAYLDDDVVLAPTWSEALNEAFSNPNVVLAGGPSAPVF